MFKDSLNLTQICTTDLTAFQRPDSLLIFTLILLSMAQDDCHIFYSKVFLQLWSLYQNPEYSS